MPDLPLGAPPPIFLSPAPPPAALLDQVSDAVLLVGPDLCCTFANACAAALFRRTPAQMDGCPLVELLPSEKGGAFYQGCLDTLAGRPPSAPDFRVLVSFQPLAARMAPSPPGLALFFADLSAQTQAEEALRRSEQRYQSLADATAQITWHIPADGRGVVDDASWRAFTGQSAGQLRGENWLDAVHPDDRALVQDAWRNALTRGETCIAQFRLRRHDGVYRDILERGVPLRDSEGAITEWVGISIDMTDQRQAERALETLTALQSAILGSADHSIISADTDGIIRTFNPAAELMLGYSASEVIGRMTPEQLHDPDEVARRAREMSRKVGRPIRPGYELFSLATARSIPHEREWAYVRKDGTRVPVSLSVTPLRDAEGIVTGSLGIAQNITERKKLEDERERLLAAAIDRADRDPLTDLFNHRAFHETLERETLRAHADGTPLAVAMLDMDNFKFFNTVYGHLAGDQVLRQVAQTLREHSRVGDTPARFGGDEFALVLPGLERIHAEQLADTLRERMARTLFQPPGSDAPVPLSLSIGVAVIPQEAPTALDAVRLADQRLRETKAGTRETLPETERLAAGLMQSRQDFDMLLGLVTAVDNKDRYARRHSEDVLLVCLALAHKLGVSAEDRQALATAALLHDIGNVGVSDTILRKPGPLTDAEWAAVRRHPTMGALIVGAVTGFENVQDIIRQHHERPDGKGYPWGLTYDELSLPSRILAVANSYCALTSDRPFRAALSVPEARRVLRDGSGSAWCRECVSALLEDAEGEPPLA